MKMETNKKQKKEDEDELVSSFKALGAEISKTAIGGMTPPK